MGYRSVQRSVPHGVRTGVADPEELDRRGEGKTHRDNGDNRGEPAGYRPDHGRLGGDSRDDRAVAVAPEQPDDDGQDEQRDGVVEQLIAELLVLVDLGQDGLAGDPLVILEVLAG